ncbi:unnamed protein product [Plutella xylostella]|uniref:(diamondback moth) hypothetical protein n=1 Tax=Plutella xylostella TaxID=51655 RepID=A0A8S4FF78_PLUXY|nr:unnamed protein product [Plutella xylostella]
MDYSTISNKTTDRTEVEEVTNGELSERYYLLKKQHDSLSLSYEATKQELHDTRRSYQTALDVQSHLTTELETHQADEQKRRQELTSKITLLQEEISALREERSETAERHASQINSLESEIRRLKEENSNQEARKSPERDPVELEETRAALTAALSEAEAAAAALEAARGELAAWQLRGEALMTELEQQREAAAARREELRALQEREAAALADLAEARAELHQLTGAQDHEPHAAKGNSLFAEVEDKRQEMAKSLIQMKQTNSKLRREVANKQAEVEALLHEKQTVWQTQLGAAAHYDRELIESYEERISQLEGLTERQRRELARWFGKQCDPASNGWLAGVLDHLKTECERLRAEVLSRGAAQLASAAQVRDLRRKMAALSAGKQPSNKNTPETKPSPQRNLVMRDITNNVKERISLPTKVEEENLPPKVQIQKLASVDDVKKRVTFN